MQLPNQILEFFNSTTATTVVTNGELATNLGDFLGDQTIGERPVRGLGDAVYDYTKIGNVTVAVDPSLPYGEMKLLSKTGTLLVDFAVGDNPILSL